MKTFLACAFFIYCLDVRAQVDSAFYLQTINIEASHLDGYFINNNSREIDSSSLSAYSGHSFSELLQEKSPIYIRQYGGEGQLSSISFRGTTPNHTTLSWNGVEIQSQTLGLADFSSFPVFLISDLTLYPGAGSSFLGSGSIGGGIVLETNLNRTKGNNGSFQYQIGSFGKQSFGIANSGGTSKTSYFFRAFYSHIDNDFEVSYRGDTYRQNNAQSELFGLVSGLNLDLGTLGQLKTEIWLNQHDRNVQPIIGDFNAEDNLIDRNFRYNLSYRKNAAKSLHEFSYSFILDNQVFNNGSPVITERSVFRTSHEWYFGRKFSVLVGADASLVNAQVSNYASDTTQNRASVFSSIKYRPLKPLELSFNISKPWIQGIKVPYLPQFLVNYTLHESSIYTVEATANASLNFRAPTLNDLFWSPGGNLNLKSETGRSLEIGIQNSYKANQLSLDLDIDAYINNINDMIQWIPGGSEIGDEGNILNFWYPENVREVQIRGFEVNANITHQINSFSYSLTSNYNYNSSLNKTIRDEFDRSLDKQLPYVPKHKGGVGFSLSYYDFGFQWQTSITGRRFTEANNEREIEAFEVTNLRFFKSLSIGKNQILNLSFDIRNVFNRKYFNYELRATPGINYLLSVNFKY